MTKLVHFLSLFSSFSTLICCAIPALLVSIGAGATLAVTVSAVPQLIWLSENKVSVFVFAGAMLMVSFLASMYSQKRSCPADRNLAAACLSAKSTSNVIFLVSVFLYLIGGFFAFLAPMLIS